MYQKEIIYMSLFDDDMKKECVGYLKLEKKQDDFRVELQVKNLPNRILGSFPIRLQGKDAWREADLLAVKDGSGKWTGHTAEEIFRAEVILPNPYKIKGQSKKVTASGAYKNELSNKVQEEIEAKEAAPIQEEKEAKGVASIRGEKERTVPVQEEKERKEAAPVSDISVKKAEQIGGQEEKAEILQEPLQEPIMPIKAVSVKQREPFAPIKQMPGKPVPLYENKWEQILATYEKIRPYGDARIYVKLEPKDFIVLRSNYQHLVNNSFLLHGFYNYRHLILGKEKEYYLGVPGVFYEREKMVALMFGFDAFECEGGAAEEGKFGYYLRKVEI